MKLTAFVFAFLTSTMAFGQALEKKSSLPEGNVSALITMSRIVDVYSDMKDAEIINECQYAEVVLGLADGLVRGELSAGYSYAATTKNDQLTDAVLNISEHIQLARATECVAVNDKCCKKAAQADQSDSCNAKTSSNCKLKAVTPGQAQKACTEGSDDC